jgi:hypothetical protein
LDLVVEVMVDQAVMEMLMLHFTAVLVVSTAAVAVAAGLGILVFPRLWLVVATVALALKVAFFSRFGMNNYD